MDHFKVNGVEIQELNEQTGEWENIQLPTFSPPPTFSLLFDIELDLFDIELDSLPTEEASMPAPAAAATGPNSPQNPSLNTDNDGSREIGVPVHLRSAAQTESMPLQLAATQPAGHVRVWTAKEHEGQDQDLGVSRDGPASKRRRLEPSQAVVYSDGQPGSSRQEIGGEGQDTAHFRPEERPQGEADDEEQEAETAAPEAAQGPETQEPEAQQEVPAEIAEILAKRQAGRRLKVKDALLLFRHQVDAGIPDLVAIQPDTRYFGADCVSALEVLDRQKSTIDQSLVTVPVTVPSQDLSPSPASPEPAPDAPAAAPPTIRNQALEHILATPARNVTIQALMQMPLLEYKRPTTAVDTHAQLPEARDARKRVANAASASRGRERKQAGYATTCEWAAAKYVECEFWKAQALVREDVSADMWERLDPELKRTMVPSGELIETYQEYRSQLGRAKKKAIHGVD